ncbi:MAG: hypothetical protein ACJLS3_07925 [Erythrobacter sp.]
MGVPTSSGRVNILADEEPTINRKKFIEFCQELIDRGLPDKVKWGINTPRCSRS